jgi:hypothetical protein
MMRCRGALSYRSISTASADKVCSQAGRFRNDEPELRTRPRCGVDAGVGMSSTAVLQADYAAFKHNQDVPADGVHTSMHISGKRLPCLT